MQKTASSFLLRDPDVAASRESWVSQVILHELPLVDYVNYSGIFGQVMRLEYHTVADNEFNRFPRSTSALWNELKITDFLRFANIFNMITSTSLCFCESDPVDED